MHKESSLPIGLAFSRMTLIVANKDWFVPA
jgi:hypothetical protein